MTRKVFSFLLCLCLVLTMMPTSIFAADDLSLPEGLYWCWAKEVSSDPFVLEYDPTEDLNTTIRGGFPGGQGMAFIYLDQNHNRTQLKITDLTTTGDYFELNKETNDCIDVHFSNVGTGGTITYVKDGVPFSIDVESEFWAPNYAFYKGSTATAQGYFKEFDYDGTNGIFYFVASNNCTITGCRVVSGPDVTPEIVNNTCVKLTINKLDDSDELVLSFDGTKSDGTAFSNREAFCWINDCQPGLYWRWPGDEDWSGDEPVFTPDPDGYLNHDISGTPYGAQYGQFVYLDENGNKEVVNCDDLTSTGNFFEMNDMGNDFTRIRTFDFGQGTISYNNKDIEIESVLPIVGFYTTPTVSQDTFVPKWEYNGTNDTIYLVPENGITLSNVTLAHQDCCDVTVSFNGGDPYATVTMNEIDSNGYLEVHYDWTDASRTRHEELGIGVVDKTPGLFWSYPNRDWPEEYVLTPEIDELQRGPIYGHPYGVHDRQFFFRDNSGNLTTLHCSDLQKSGNCFEMEDFQGVFIRMRFPAFGEGTVSYQGYSIRIITDLPDVGLYKNPTATKENCLIGHLDYNGDNNTIYLIARDDKTLSNVKNMNSNQMMITLNSDQTCATIELQNLVYPGDYALELRFDVTTRDALTYGDSIDFSIYDVRPGLCWRRPELVNGEWVSDPTAPIYHDSYIDINIYEPREFLFRDTDGSLIKLSASDLTASDPFIDISDYESGMVLVGCTEFGTGTINYGNYSIDITSQIPYIGLYSKAQRSEENYLSKWDPTEMDTAYLYCAYDDVVITGVSEETDNGATFEILNGGEYVAVHLENNKSDFLKIKTVFHFTFASDDREGYLGIDLVLPQNTEPEPTPSGGNNSGGGGSTPKPEEPAVTPEEPAEQPAEDPLQEEVTVEVTDPETGETVEVEVTKAAAEAADKFIDVEPTDYFAEAVGYAVEKGITAGISANEFGPDLGCTRAQVVTFLWAANGSPEAEGKADFTDVKESAYYEEAVAWALEQDITAGTGNNEFSPEETVTRAQFIMMLWISQGKPEVESGIPFEDVPANEYYAKAVAWAYANGITAGKSATNFGPDDPCTRGQIVTFLHIALDK